MLFPSIEGGGRPEQLEGVGGGASVQANEGGLDGARGRGSGDGTGRAGMGPRDWPSLDGMALQEAVPPFYTGRCR